MESEIKIMKEWIFNYIGRLILLFWIVVFIVSVVKEVEFMNWI